MKEKQAEFVKILKDELAKPETQEMLKEAFGEHADLFATQLIEFCSEIDFLSVCRASDVIQTILKAADARLPLGDNVTFPKFNQGD